MVHRGTLSRPGAFAGAAPTPSARHPLASTSFRPPRAAHRGGGVLLLPPGVRRWLARWARAAYPDEACGCLLGLRSAGRVEVRHARLGTNTNTERARDRYELDPRDLLRADDEARALGLDVVGIWHSHPDHPAVPSETDRTGAWEGWSYVIVAVGSGGVSGIRAWRLSGDAFLEEEIRS